MGDDGYEATSGYMLNGDIPIFKIFDFSENTYYYAEASEDIPWENLALNVMDNLNVDFDIDNDGVVDNEDLNPNSNLVCADTDVAWPAISLPVAGSKLNNPNSSKTKSSVKSVLLSKFVCVLGSPKSNVQVTLISV